MIGVVAVLGLGGLIASDDSSTDHGTEGGAIPQLSTTTERQHAPTTTSDFDDDFARHARQIPGGQIDGDGLETIVRSFCSSLYADDNAGIDEGVIEVGRLIAPGSYTAAIAEIVWGMREVCPRQMAKWSRFIASLDDSTTTAPSSALTPAPVPPSPSPASTPTPTTAAPAPPGGAPGDGHDVPPVPPQGWTCNHIDTHYGGSEAPRGHPYYSPERDQDNDGTSCDGHPPAP